MDSGKMNLRPRTTPNAEVCSLGDTGWRLTLPPGPEGEYRWAQLDDYLHRKRKDFLWRPPFRLKLRSRISSENVPGTWGFGLWNDPFSFSLGVGGASRRLPALPNAAWFFFAGDKNYLSFRDGSSCQWVPDSGFLLSFDSIPVVGVGTAICAAFDGSQNKPLASGCGKTCDPGRCQRAAYHVNRLA